MCAVCCRLDICTLCSNERNSVTSIFRNGHSALSRYDEAVRLRLVFPSFRMIIFFYISHYLNKLVHVYQFQKHVICFFYNTINFFLFPTINRLNRPQFRASRVRQKWCKLNVLAGCVQVRWTWGQSRQVPIIFFILRHQPSSAFSANTTCECTWAILWRNKSSMFPPTTYMHILASDARYLRYCWSYFRISKVAVYPVCLKLRKGTRCTLKTCF